MILVLAALTGTAFGTGVIVGLALGASTLAGTYAYREARRVGGKKGPRRPGRAERCGRWRLPDVER